VRTKKPKNAVYKTLKWGWGGLYPLALLGIVFNNLPIDIVLQLYYILYMDKEIEELDDNKCPDCATLLEIEWDNTGFDAPDPQYWEVVSVWCNNCGYKQS